MNYAAAAARRRLYIYGGISSLYCLLSYVLLYTTTHKSEPLLSWVLHFAIHNDTHTRIVYGPDVGVYYSLWDSSEISLKHGPSSGQSFSVKYPYFLSKW